MAKQFKLYLVTDYGACGPHDNEIKSSKEGEGVNGENVS